jgi:hypothetical protein
MKKAERRIHFRQGLSTLYLPFYDALCEALPDHWQPYCGIRDIAAQERLYAIGRTTAPLGKANRVTNAQGGFSAHNYGCASDWAWFDGPDLVWLHKNAPAWQEYRRAVEHAGLRWGGEFGDVDHNEIKLSCDWPHIHQKWSRVNMTSAQEHIAANLIGHLPDRPVK